MKVLLSGVGGAIGVHVLSHIMHNTDWEVVVIDSFNHLGYYDRITRVCCNHQDWLPRIEIIRHDLTAPLTERETKRLGKIDYILNLASLSDVQGSIDDPVPFVRNNTEIMLTVLELARKIKPNIFLHFSTDEVYGPAPKDYGHAEWDTILPSNPYSASKAAQEAIAIAYWRSYGVPLVITNTMNNFGEMQGATKYPAMVQNKVAKGEKVTVHIATDSIGTRYYIHSRNTADAVLFLLQNTTPYLHQPGEIDRPDRYNIVGDKQVDNLELAQTIARLMGKELDYDLVNFHKSNPGHDLHYGLNGNKLSALGWKSPIPFEESLKNTIDWQQRNPEWL